jgi:hypothetical protein
MTKEVLENVYFVLGKTTKNDSTTVGGFARARILTNFAMDRYMIHTLDNIVIGSGSEYDIQKGRHLQGCMVTIWNSEDSAAGLSTTLLEYLSRCDMRHPATGESVVINFNGSDILSRCPAGPVYRELKEEMDFFMKTESGRAWATLHEGPKHETGNMIHVRVHGNEMFSISTHTSRSYILEIKPEFSREVLAASRDSMKYKYQEILNEFVGKMVSDEEAARNPPKKVEERFFEGSGWTMTAKSGGDTIHLHPAGAQPPKGFRVGELVAELQGDWKKIFSDEFHEAGIEYEHDGDGYKVPVKHIVPSTPILIEGTDPRLWKLAEQYDPNNWFINVKGNAVYTGNWVENYNLLATFKEACRQAMLVMVEHEMVTESVQWCAGFVLSDDPKVLALTRSNYGYETGSYGQTHRLMINPLGKNLKPKFKLGKTESLKEILASAAHEVCHCFNMEHNTAFAMILTDFLQNHNQNDILAAMRSAKF